jgi:hypothetical protein
MPTMLARLQKKMNAFAWHNTIESIVKNASTKKSFVSVFIITIQKFLK